MCEQLLANGVIEDFRVEIVEGAGASVRWGVVTFPGSQRRRDTLRVAERVLGDEAVPLWHKDEDLRGVDCVVLPGGFSYGDYLRCGAIARFSPVMGAVARHAAGGGLVLGICNGFQILCEAACCRARWCATAALQLRLRPGAPCASRPADTPFTYGCRRASVLALPIKHGEGCYVADEATLAELEANGQVSSATPTAPAASDAGGQPERLARQRRRRLQRASATSSG